MTSGLYGAPSCAILSLIMSIYLSNESRESFGAHDEFLLKQQRSMTITSALPCPLTPLLYKHICHMPTIFGTATVHAVIINQLYRQYRREISECLHHSFTVDRTKGSEATASLTDLSASLPLTLPAPFSISNHLFGTTNMLRPAFCVETSNCSYRFTYNDYYMYVNVADNFEVQMVLIPSVPNFLESQGTLEDSL